jgi:hypothetical protein
MEEDIFAGLPQPELWSPTPEGTSWSPFDHHQTFTRSLGENPSTPFAFPQSPPKNTVVDESEKVKYNYDAMPPSLSPISCQNPTNHLT